MGAASTATDKAAATAADATTVSALLAAFRQVFLGAYPDDATASAFASAHGVTLAAGVMYENTTSAKMRIYGASGWGDYDATAQASQSAAGLSAANAAASALAARPH
jgi:hypothetical protein